MRILPNLCAIYPDLCRGHWHAGQLVADWCIFGPIEFCLN